MADDGTVVLAILVIVALVVIFLRHGKERYSSQLPRRFPKRQYILQSMDGLDPATIAEAGESEMNDI